VNCAATFSIFCVLFFGGTSLSAASSLIVLTIIVCTYDSTTRYPGLHALAPTLAAAALLITGIGRRALRGSPTRGLPERPQRDGGAMMCNETLI
jgi:hypothetical protein